MQNMQKTEAKQEPKNLPEKHFRAGPIRSTVWANQRKDQEGNDVTWYSVSLDRSFRNKEGAWQSTQSMRVTDLPKAALVLNKSYEYLVLKNDEASEAS